MIQPASHPVLEGMNNCAVGCDTTTHRSTSAVIRLINDRFASNAYVAICGSQALVIDPADVDSGRIVTLLSDQRVSEVLIVLTHEHFDHMSGVNRLREKFMATQLVCSRSCSENIATPTGNFSRYLAGVDLVCGAADLLCENIHYEMEWSGGRLEMIATPGHTFGSICIVMEEMLFSGDTVIWNCPTVTRLPGGRQDQLKQSIALLMERIPPSTVVCPGHGESFLFRQIDPEIILGVVKPYVNVA
jgi:glyoxylase-like metal-dependent hydrolase (beta-lactamase superfamily II)